LAATPAGLIQPQLLYCGVNMGCCDKCADLIQLRQLLLKSGSYARIASDPTYRSVVVFQIQDPFVTA
jgi:hypothetical protein